MLDAKAFLKMLQLDLSGRPPVAPVLKVHLKAEPVKPRRTQHGLFVPSSPEPEKLELTVARLRHLVGDGQVGTPELVDTHRPDSFLMRGFAPRQAMALNTSALRLRRQPIAAAVFTPLSAAEVCAGDRGEPAAGAGGIATVNGRVVMAKGPWRTSGEWWRRTKRVESR